MPRTYRSVIIAALSILTCSQFAPAQSLPPTILAIELDNFVNYFNDVTDYSKLATDPNRLSLAVQPRNFAQSVAVADIISVNGKPAKGTFTERRTALNHAVNPNPGQAIADSVRQNWSDRYYEILNPDGTAIGSIFTSGPGGGNPIPGAPSAMLGADFVVVGGTGAFMGVRGQSGGTQDPRPGPRDTSMLEDPAKRRVNGGGQRRFIIEMIPLSRPQIVQTASGPAVVHSSDFTAVTTAKPARAGEILTLIATGLGPTRPGVEPGAPFPATPLALANSPIDITVNGQPAEVQYAGGYPGTTDIYQVNFRLPAGIPSGVVSIQLSAAWIAGPEVKISVQQ